MITSITNINNRQNNLPEHNILAKNNLSLEFKEDANGEAAITQENHYYPFGMRFSGEVFANNDNDFRYNGKELQDDFGLDWYDYGARFYDAQLARFHTIDPISEKSSFQSPFVYANNNPIACIDLNGLEGYKVTTHNKATSHTHVKFVFNIKVVNNSSAPDNNVTNWSNSIKKSTEKIFRGHDSESNTTYSTEVNLDFSSNSKNEYVMEFSDKVLVDEQVGLTNIKRSVVGHQEEIGNVNNNKMRILIPGKSATKISKEVTVESVMRTGPHEIGHTSGLEHQSSSFVDNPVDIESDNLMYIYGKNGANIIVEQLKIMENIIPERDDVFY